VTRAASRGGLGLWPVLAGFSRLAIHWLGGGMIAFFAVMSLAFVLFGLTLALGVRSGAFRRGDQALART
jgi:hypothetical protein